MFLVLYNTKVKQSRRVLDSPALGNNTVVYKYTYDETTGFLVREDNADAGKSYVYAYDEMGNILNRYSYAFTTGALGSLTGTKTWYNGTSSTFGKLCFGISGQDDLWIDSFGNPYYNNETCEYFDWNGRELTRYDNGHDEYYYYYYNSDGIRTKKVYDYYGEETTTYYIVDGTQILSEICSDGTQLDYYYDENGSPVALHYSNSGTYYYYKNIFGDILGIMDSCGNIVVRYYYDAWGNIISTTGSMASTLGRDNPFRYRGYYYDIETGYYYLNARYYNPEWCRFISADPILDTSSAISCNLYSYCGNDSVNRFDHSGGIWDTIFDVISLASSIVEVCVNPADPWAWAGLAGDAVDLIPFVTGVGEATRAVKTTVKVVDKATDVVDTAKTIYKTADATSDIRKATGSYEILYKSGKNYIGKGGFDRAIASATRNATKYGDEVTSIMWKSAPDSRTAFIDEYLMQKKFGGVLSSNKDLPTYNKIWSPGRRYFGD